MPSEMDIKQALGNFVAYSLTKGIPVSMYGPGKYGYTPPPSNSDNTTLILYAMNAAYDAVLNGHYGGDAQTYIFNKYRIFGAGDQFPIRFSFIGQSGTFVLAPNVPRIMAQAVDPASGPAAPAQAGFQLKWVLIFAAAAVLWNVVTQKKGMARGRK